MNNFLNDPYVINQLKLGGQQNDEEALNQINQEAGMYGDGAGQDDDELEVELTEEEFQYAVKMTDVSIRQLTK